jgi:hypothetical protein
MSSSYHPLVTDFSPTGRKIGNNKRKYLWLARETAERLGYPYPAEADQHTTALVQAYLSERA